MVSSNLSTRKTSATRDRYRIRQERVEHSRIVVSDERGRRSDGDSLSNCAAQLCSTRLLVARAAGTDGYTTDTVTLSCLKYTSTIYTVR